MTPHYALGMIRSSINSAIEVICLPRYAETAGTAIFHTGGQLDFMVLLPWKGKGLLLGLYLHR